MTDLANEIREIVREELEKVSNLSPKVNNTQVKEEIVSIQTSLDLNRFARRILEVSQDQEMSSAILAGRHVFRLEFDQDRGNDINKLDAWNIHPKSNLGNSSESTSRLSTELVSEKDISGLSKVTKILLVGKTTCFTPLARDEIRRRNLKIERIDS